MNVWHLRHAGGCDRIRLARWLDLAAALGSDGGMRYLFGIVCLALAACAPDDRHQPVTEQPVTERPEPVAGVTRANTEIARDFLDLSFRLESGRHLPVLSRFEGPVTVRLVPPAPPLASEDLDALLGRPVQPIRKLVGLADLDLLEVAEIASHREAATRHERSRLPS